MTKGYLIEYKKKKDKPLCLEFEFNPQELIFSRSLATDPGKKAQKCYGFSNPKEAAVEAWKMSSDPMTFAVKILLDSTYRAADPNQKMASVATTSGIQPELDLLNLMTTFGSGPGKRKRALAVAADGSKKSFQRHTAVPVLLFGWGELLLPVLVTQCSVSLTKFMSDLTPLRAEATLNMKVIEGDNPIYQTEQLRQLSQAAQHTNQSVEPNRFMER